APAAPGLNGTLASEVPPEAHVLHVDVPPPPPLAALRGAEAELEGMEAEFNEPSPLPRIPIYQKPRRAKNATKKTIEPIVRVKKMTEPIVRMKNGNGTHKISQPVVQVVVKKKAPSLDAPEKALAWLQAMVKNVNVSAIPTMLDYYRRLGWIPNEAYGWLVELATGLTKSAQPATWRMVKNDPAQLASIHRESYKHLKGLFGERMNRTV
ncbi:MAG TPA: FlaD/FlaE family flagellar protein, partial [Candidatus Thermoplasmatota archaeon]